MLKSGLFSVVFKVEGVKFREEYNLLYRTEEDYRCLSDKIISVKDDFIKQAGFFEALRFEILVFELGL